MKTKKILALALAAMLLVAVSVAGTIAYLQDATDPVTNTFTPSNIDIDLTETQQGPYQLIPHKEYAKNPTVVVDTTKTNLPIYVFVKVTDTTAGYIDYTSNLTEANGWKLVTGYTDVYYHTWAPGETASWELISGNTITIADLDKTQTSDTTTVAGMKLEYQAWAIQQEGFNGDVAQAYKTAAGIQ